MSPPFDPLEQARQLAAQGQLDEAERLCRKILRKQPANTAALGLQGKLLLQSGHHEEARTQLRRALRLAPANTETSAALAMAESACGDPAAALQLLQKALADKPDDASLYFHLGNAEDDLGHADKAIAAFARAAEIAPDFFEAQRNHGILLASIGRHAEALQALNAACSLEPDDFSSRYNRARALLALQNPLDALNDLDRAIAVQPQRADAHNLRGIVLQKLQRFNDALAAFSLATLLQADFPAAHWNEALCRLALGDWERAVWEKFEAGWAIGQRQPRRSFTQALWLGETSLAGRTLFVHDEQGFGDTIQFARFTKDLADRGARVILQVQPPLKSLMQGLKGPSCVIAEGEEPPPFDCHIPLLSLPLALGVRPTNIPADQAYLNADPHLIGIWQNRLGPKRVLRAGIVWAGNPAQNDDINRSMPLECMLGLQMEGIELISLQKDMSPADAMTLEARGILNAGKMLKDFSDTAALITQLDLVISVCTSVAHLGGALGAPTWVLLSRSPCWRWLRERDDSPWYPSVRLFRQRDTADWNAVMANVRDALCALI